MMLHTAHKPLVILAAHGSGDDSAANRRVEELACFVATRRPTIDVIAAFNLGAPRLTDVLSAHPDRPVLVLPLMTSAGYFAGDHLRRQISSAGIDTKQITVAPAVGVHDRCRYLISQRVLEAAARAGLSAASTSVLVVGHGTRRSATSGGTTVAAAEAVREVFAGADVGTAFLDQEPLLEDVAARPLRENVIVAPFLIGGGEHARVDIPTRLGIADVEPDALGARRRADGRRVLVLPPLGEGDGFAEIVLACVDEALPHRTIRLGTRSSPLALWQARRATEALALADVHAELVTIESDGDRDQSRPIEAFPTDGPFTDALERALLRGEIDAAAHSLKDLPLVATPGTRIAAYLPRGAGGEALVARQGLTLSQLPSGARVGTCSRRRSVQLRRLRPDVTIISIRGTIEQRLEKLRAGDVDALVLAVAGLERLGLQGQITQRFTLDEMMPEAGQGAIAIQTRDGDGAGATAAAHADHAPTRAQVEAERAFSRIIAETTGLIAAVHVNDEDGLRLRGRAFSADGLAWIDVDRRGEDAGSLAVAAAGEVRARVRAAAQGAQAPASRHVGSVSLVGAGPGDPGLMTVRGLKLLRRADVVVYDRLIDLSLLDEAPAHAERIDAGKSPGNHVLTQDETNALIVDRALRGQRVVRLKGGDPYVFGRGFEELRACRRAGISCEVVSGVTSAIAAPAAAGIPVTMRGVARTMAVVTPQAESGAENPALDYAALARLDTVVVLMARGALAEVAEGFIGAGRSPATPAAVVQNGTLPTQRLASGTLADIARRADDAGLGTPAILIVGETVALASEEANAGNGRLSGKRIVVTRPHSASPGLIAMLRAEGAEVVNCPLIRIAYRTPDDLSVLQNSHEWTVFTSLHAVRGFWRVLQGLGRDARVLGPSRIAAVGPKTAEELHAIGIRPDLVPGVHRASALIDALAPSIPQGGRVLFPHGTLARDEMRVGLRARGILVDELEVYETLPQRPTPEAIADIKTGVDAILLYCPSGAASAADAGLLSHGTPIACIGPTTAAKVRELGFTPAVVPTVYGDRGLIDALADFFQHAAQGATA
jgi:uroporphyrinogen III methyltransferase/synthase